MLVIGFILLLGLAVTLIVLDLLRKVNLMRPLFLALYLLTASNLAAWGWWIYNVGLAGLTPAWRTSYMIIAGFFICYLWIRLTIFPVLDGKRAPLRAKVMIGGRFLTYCALWFMLAEALFLGISYPMFRRAGAPDPVLAANIIYGVCVVFSLLWNGILRMFFTSKRLGIFYRIIMVLVMWIPLVNLLVLAYGCRLVYEEYDFAVYREDLRKTRVDFDLCRTKYPLVMVHGILFRDLKYFNYWGRIPKELTRYGAAVYYGNQEAVGTIVTNANDLRDKIREVLEETGCEKVNIIAHSKGGLDARYAISALGMDDYVASLTTMNTPHRGCEFVDKAAKMPEGLYRFIARIFDKTFRKFGDKEPDFYTATHQFTTALSEEFNREVPDSPKVCYQSYMTKMNTALSDTLLTVPYSIIKPLEGDNDGLVSVKSAPWGNFRGLIVSKGRRGISHGDIIDLKREDYKGFDILETYINIVSDLKNQGF